jgi:hypothetical protein
MTTAKNAECLAKKRRMFGEKTPNVWRKNAECLANKRHMFCETTSNVCQKATKIRPKNAEVYFIAMTTDFSPMTRRTGAVIMQRTTTL